MNKIFLKLVMLPSGLWRGMGADTAQLEAILDVRLKLDDRKPMPIGKQSQKKERKHMSWVSMFVSLLMGFIYMLPLAAIHDRITGLTVYFALFLFILTLMLITDFSNVLFDTRDKFIIVPRPVNDTTMVLSRLLHVFIYLFRVVLPMSLPGWVVLGLQDGWASVTIFIFPLILLVCVAVFLVNGMYLLLLKLAKPERFKDIINYFQIAFSIVFFASSYLMRTFLNDNNGINMLNLDISKYAWVRFIPPYWMASFWSLIGFHATLPGTPWLVILAITFPVFCLWILVKYLAPQFASSIGGIDVVSSAEYTSSAAINKTTTNSKFYQRLATMLNSNDASKAGFMITWLQTSRSRSFKMKVYPTFAYVPVYFVFLLTSNGRMGFKEAWANLADSPKFLILLYMCSFVLVQAINYLTISDQYKAAWVYYAAPVTNPGFIMAGAFKAIWVRYFLPLFSVFAIFTMAVWGWQSITDVILALINVTLFAACMMRVGYRHLPFSVRDQMSQGGNRIVKGLVSMAIPTTLGFGHYFAIHLLWLKLIFMVLSAILLWLVWDSYENTTWDAMWKTELE